MIIHDAVEGRLIKIFTAMDISTSNLPDATLFDAVRDSPPITRTVPNRTRLLPIYLPLARERERAGAKNRAIYRP